MKSRNESTTFNRRLRKMLNSGVVAFGGETDPEDLYVGPTILVNVKPTDPVMQVSPGR
jgi:acyl-CoA reductase-like NAD-dependent aldehyde dehydrogenase